MATSEKDAREREFQQCVKASLMRLEALGQDALKRNAAFSYELDPTPFNTPEDFVVFPVAGDATTVYWRRSENGVVQHTFPLADAPVDVLARAVLATKQIETEYRRYAQWVDQQIDRVLGSAK